MKLCHSMFIPSLSQLPDEHVSHGFFHGTPQPAFPEDPNYTTSHPNDHYRHTSKACGAAVDLLDETGHARGSAANQNMLESF